MTVTVKEPPEKLPAKKPYEAPQLEAYGDVRDIARNVGVTGMADGFLIFRTR
jgi:hypothetical protein